MALFCLVLATIGYPKFAFVIAVSVLSSYEHCSGLIAIIIFWYIVTKPWEKVDDDRRD